MNNGEEEWHDWWVRHESLFEEARLEWGTLHEELYNLELFADTLLTADTLEAVRACERAAILISGSDETPYEADSRKRPHCTADEATHASALEAAERKVRSLLSEVAPGVWRLSIFTPRFCRLLLEELQHYETSGIPLRRPNGMNRFGAILDQLGLEASLSYLCRRILRPLGSEALEALVRDVACAGEARGVAQLSMPSHPPPLGGMLFPELIGRGDADYTYGFVVKYRMGEDVALAEHADASVLTLNVNLGMPGFTGGELVFKGTRFLDDQPRQMPAHTVGFAQMTPGDGILHLGGQYHAALPLTAGERVNFVLWMFGKHGVVRVAPYEETERLDAMQRWGAYAEEEMQHQLRST
eukprot:CAMPEP_0119400998 /NCGR_PEP_ID=MMETSP1334-20130426/142148_1 /TAXON_ID=127549 /ORGANISM="Calcidiscus leptoporus, Strain RCC1130" /LENGTH=355 /DNA_ID=CAMNT_0007424909 /DNA_START=89 /DNA_END=1156 /DNA_ORIENTATION=+